MHTDPAGLWDPIPGVSKKAPRAGMEEFLSEAGFKYFFIDTHMAEAGEALGWSGDVPHGTERFDASFHGETRTGDKEASRSAYQAYYVGDPSAGKGLAAFVREPKASMQVWSRQQGYPGDGSYLEFHKIRWPSGLKYWSVTGSNVDLGGKKAYDPQKARYRASDHATHFSGFLGHIQRKEAVGPSGVAMAPFDTELFGHWWFEGVDFLRELFTRLPYREGVIPVTASEHLDSFPAPGGHSTPGGILGCQRRFQHVAERGHPLDLGAFVAAGRHVLGNRSSGHGKGGDPDHPGSRSQTAPPSPVLRLAVHDLHRRRTRLRRTENEPPLR